VKTDRNYARGIAHLMRLGWFRPVHCKSLPAQELRAVLTARKLVQGKKHDIEMSLRGINATVLHAACRSARAASGLGRRFTVHTLRHYLASRTM
jgi:hypothetical protein